MRKTSDTNIMTVKIKWFLTTETSNHLNRSSCCQDSANTATDNPVVRATQSYA
jgi:hypothetical protein